MHCSFAIRRKAAILTGSLLLLCMATPVIAQRPVFLTGNKQNTSFDTGRPGPLAVKFRALYAEEMAITADDALLPPTAAKWLSFLEQVEKTKGSAPTRIYNTYRGFGLFMMGLFTEAATANREAIAGGPYPPATFNLVLDEIKLGDLPEARRDLKAGIQAGGSPIVDLTPLKELIDNAEAAEKLVAEGNAAYDAEDYQKAFNQFSAAFRLQRDNGSILSDLGRTLWQAGKIQLAGGAYMIAANRSAPADPEPHIGLGAAYCALKKVEASAKEFVVAQLLDTKTQRPRFARAHCLESLNDWPSARAVLKESVALAPDDPEVLNNMGFSLADHDEELDAALAMVQRASNADPSNAFYLDSLSWVQFKLGHYAEALEASKAALSRLPVNPEVMEHFADIAERNGRPDVAKGAWITAKKFSNDDVQKARLTVKIDRLAGVTAFQPEE